MFILAIFGLSFPDEWLIPIRPLANANTLFIYLYDWAFLWNFVCQRENLKLVLKI